eukprot:3311953-Pleurochrysis_carterae.AAC.6
MAEQFAMGAHVPEAELLLALHELRRASIYRGRRLSEEIGGLTEASEQLVPPTPAQDALETILRADPGFAGPKLLALIGSKGCTSYGQALAFNGLYEKSYGEAVSAIHRFFKPTSEATESAAVVASMLDLKNLARQMPILALLAHIDSRTTEKHDALTSAGIRVAADIARYCLDSSGMDGGPNDADVSEDVVSALCFECMGALSMSETKALVTEAIRLCEAAQR